MRTTPYKETEEILDDIQLFLLIVVCAPVMATWGYIRDGFAADFRAIRDFAAHRM